MYLKDETIFLVLLLVIIVYQKRRIKVRKYNTIKYISSMKVYDIQYDFSWQRVNPEIYEKLTNTEIAAGNYASVPINQHKTKWCGCCYMVATLQMIQDRLHVSLGKKNTNTRMSPWVVIDLQSMLNHYQKHKGPYTRGWNSCKGGIPLSLLNAIENKNVPLMFDLRKTKWMGHPEIIASTDISNTKISIENSRRITPTSLVEEEILKNGPVLLSISGALLKKNDEHGFITSNEILKINHAVTVIGWVHKNNKKYWIIRNSWGKEHVPKNVPQDMSCVTTYSNKCIIEKEKWSGDPNNPGHVYLDASYAPLNDDENSPWFVTYISEKNILV